MTRFSVLIVLPFCTSLAQAQFDLRLIKYSDLDEDGTPNEVDTRPGNVSGNVLTGWEFFVFDSNGAPIARGTTSVEAPGSGDLGIRFTIPNLTSGEEYTICETQQPGWTNTDPGTIDPTYGEPCETLVLTATGRFINVFFGNVAPDTYELRMIKYNDLDEDGSNNEVNTGAGTEPSGNALTGWEFVVYDSSGTEVGRNTTSVENPGANGDLGIRAEIPGLISGEEYTICETQQPGWTNTEPGTIDPAYGEPCETVTLTSSTSVTRYFGNVAPDLYDVLAVKYNDLDEDGTPNEVDTSPGGDSGNTLTGWEFVVYDSNGFEVGRNTTSIESAGSGDLGRRATIPGLISGEDYTICEVEQPGWTNSDPGTIDPAYGQPCKDLTLTSSTFTFMLFGNVELDFFTLRVVKYNDLDADGTNNEVDTSPGGVSGNTLTGWEFVVYDSNGLEVGRNTTSAENPGSGDIGIRASFPGLISGQQYTICETQQPGWMNTQPGTIDPTYGEPCETVTLSTPGSSVTRFFGNVAVATDLAIGKSDGSATANSGEPLTWIIEVTNNGPLAVQGASVLDELPPAIEPFANWECIASPGASCNASGPGSIQQLIDLEVGASVVFALSVDIPDDFSGLVENEASVATPAGIDDYRPGNNIARDRSIVVLFADGFETPLEAIMSALRELEQR